MSDAPREPRREDFQTPAGRNPFGTEMATRPVGALANAEQQRSIAEVQARMIIARANPRDPLKAMDLILRDCTRPTLAMGALYQYARGGSAISGPSIRLAEAIAQRWGNIASGIKEIGRSGGYSECVAYAWDLETGYYDERQFQVRHWRDTRQGGHPLTDERDIYELIANMGQRRKRAVMLTVIPGDVVEAAVEQCEQTLNTTADTSPEALQRIAVAFEQYGVTRVQIEKRCQCHLEAIRPAQVVQLRKIYASLKDGMSDAKDWFETPNGAWSSVEKAHAESSKPAEEQPARTAPRKAAAKKAAAPAQPQDDGIPFDRWDDQQTAPQTDQTPVTAATQATGGPNPPAVADPVPAEATASAAAPAPEERSTQSPSSGDGAFSAWLVDGEGNELADSDGVIEAFSDPVAFARAYKEVEAATFPGDLGLFYRANQASIDLAMQISEEAAAIFVPPMAPSQNVAPAGGDSPALPLNLPPLDAAFIPPPEKSTKAEFNAYVDRFKALLSAASSKPAVDHLVTMNSPTTERRDFLSSSRLQIRAAIEARLKELAPSGVQAETMEQLALGMLGEIQTRTTFEALQTWSNLPAVKARLADLEAGDHAHWVQVSAALRSAMLLKKVYAATTVAQLQAMNRDPWSIEQQNWLSANARVVADNTAAAAKAYVEEVKKREGLGA